MVKIDYSKDEKFTEFGLRTVQDRYLLESERSPQDMYARVAEAYGSNEGHKQRLYDYMSDMWFSPATPILSNGGTDRGLPISCFLLQYPDSMAGIADTWNEICAMASKGGGIGTDMSQVRAMGEPIKDKGTTSGIVPFIKVQDSLALAISQAGTRRGSSAVYLPVNHPEIEEFIRIRKLHGGDPNRKCENVHNAVTVTDAFMEDVEKGAKHPLVSPATGEKVGEIDARELWASILDARLETGEPYLMFVDTVNRALPEHHKQLGLKVTQSNLCVAPETPLLTSKGYFPISELEDQEVEVWNGAEWSKTVVRKTGVNKSLLRVCLTNGKVLECTPEHKFYVDTQEGRDEPALVEVRCKDLRPGMELELFSEPVFNTRGGVGCYFSESLTVSGVFDFGRRADTFCVTEPKRGKVVFNGILTGNCSEITLPTGVDTWGRRRSAVCCLSSLNLEYFDEWKDDELFIEDVLRMLDNVLTDFIKRGRKDLPHAAYSAICERSVGLGVMGLHSFFQSKSICFDGAMAKVWNKRIFSHIRAKSGEANAKLGRELGSCPDVAAAEHRSGDALPPRRFSYCLAVAPTASISTICGGSSPGIEPYAANVVTHKTLSGSFVVRNKNLEKVLDEWLDPAKKERAWAYITSNKGSVLGLADELCGQSGAKNGRGYVGDAKDGFERDLEPFKTAFEINQQWIVDLAADRAPLIDQSQSVNLFLPGDCSKDELHRLHYSAWKKGVKTLYYLRSASVGSAESVYRAVPKPNHVAGEGEECLACQ